MSLKSIKSIPIIMKAKGWHQGAKFLDRWFSRAAYTKASSPTSAERQAAYNIGDLNGWLLKKTEGKFAYEKIFDRTLWSSDNDVDGQARKKLTRILKAQNILNKNARLTPFGFKNYTAFEYEDNNHYINASSFKTDSGTPLTETVAALGSFVLKFGLHGRVSHQPTGGAANRYFVIPESLDIYLWDSFDFEDDGWVSQPLGYWDDSTNTVTKEIGIGPGFVYNITFRNWRIVNKMGGDFYICSDILRVPLPPKSLGGFSIYA